MTSEFRRIADEADARGSEGNGGESVAPASGESGENKGVNAEEAENRRDGTVLQSYTNEEVLAAEEAKAKGRHLGYFALIEHVIAPDW